MKIIDQSGRVQIRTGEVIVTEVTAGRLLGNLVNDSAVSGAGTADMTILSNAHLVLDNPTGDQTKILFTFASGTRGGFRSDLGGSLNLHAYGGGYHQFWNSLDTSLPAMVIRGGQVGIGTTAGSLPNEMLEIGGGAILMNAISTPSLSSGGAKLYARDNSGTTEMFVLDDAANETQISAHAMDAPQWLYDADDPFPRVVRDINHFLGVVRYTNESRLAKLQEIVLAGGSLGGLTADQKKIVHQETFEQHNTRVGPENPLVRQDWQVLQDNQQATYDARRQDELEQQHRDPNFKVRPAKDIRKSPPAWLQARLGP